MQTLFLTMPELERAARQWAVDFLHENWGAVSVVTDLAAAKRVPYDDSKIVLFERARPDVLDYVLQRGGHPWLVSDIMSRTPARTHYRM